MEALNSFCHPISNRRDTSCVRNEKQYYGRSEFYRLSNSLQSKSIFLMDKTDTDFRYVSLTTESCEFVPCYGQWYIERFFFEEENRSSPFVMGRYLETYHSGRVYISVTEFVQAQHEQGLLVPRTNLATQDHQAL